MTTAAITVPGPKMVGLTRRWLVAILIAATLSFAGKVTITSRTFGSTDALLWEANLKQLREAGPVALYETGTILRRDDGKPYSSQVFNHPPFMLRLISLFGWLSGQTGMPLRFWLRVLCAAADLGSILLILGILHRAHLRTSPLALFLVAASPISLFISGFHGNTDPIMVALLLLTVYLIHGGGQPWRAGVALGLAASIKIVPLLFLPALVLSLPVRKAAMLLSSAIVVLFVASLPIVLDYPGLIWSHVFAYSPQSGIWGISRFVAAFGTEAQRQAYAHVAKGLLLLVLGSASVWLNLQKPRPPIILQCGLVAFLLLSLTPGFGVQYLAWLVPWACLLNGRQAIWFHSIGGLFLAWYYTRAAHGFPWYLADSAATPVWSGSLILVGLLCWLVICCLTFALLRRTLDLRDQGLHTNSTADLPNPENATA